MCVCVRAGFLLSGGSRRERVPVELATGLRRLDGGVHRAARVGAWLCACLRVYACVRARRRARERARVVRLPSAKYANAPPSRNKSPCRMPNTHTHTHKYAHTRARTNTPYALNRTHTHARTRTRALARVRTRLALLQHGRDEPRRLRHVAERSAHDGGEGALALPLGVPLRVAVALLRCACVCVCVSVCVFA